MTKIRLAFADDSVQSQKAIAKLIQPENDLDLILTAQNGQELVDKLKNQLFDIVVLDIRMPKMDGIEAAKKIKQAYPDLKIIALSQHDFEENILKMYSVGVRSFVGKEDDPTELLKAIRIVFDGGIYITERTTEIIQRNLSKVIQPELQMVNLSEQEQLLARFIMQGLSSREIGKLLSKSPRTVEDMREKLYQKFNVLNKEQLIVKLTQIQRG